MTSTHTDTAATTPAAPPPAPLPPDRFADPLFAEVLAGRAAAHAKHGDNSIERLPYDFLGWLAILGEEFGEVCGTLTYDKDAGHLRGELLDVLAVASAWATAIDRADGYADGPAWASPLWAEVLEARSRRTYDPTEPADAQWLRGLGDEFGILCEVMRYGADKPRPALIGVLAVAAGWVDAIDRAVLSS